MQLAVGSLWFHRLVWTAVVLEAVQGVLGLVVLALTGAAVSAIHGSLQTTSLPAKLRYNLILPAITTGFITIAAALDYTRRSNRFHPAWARYRWLRLAINVLFLVLWAAASGTSVYICGDICFAGTPAFVRYANLCCNCAMGAPIDCVAGSEEELVVIGNGSLYGATQGLDATELILFFVSTIIAMVFVLAKPSPHQMEEYDLQHVGKHRRMTDNE